MIKIVCHYFSFQIDHALVLASIISVDLPAMNAWMSAEGLRFVIIKRSFASFCQLVINNAWQRNGELGAVELHFGCFVPGDLRQSSYSTRLRTLCPATRRQLLRQTHPSPARHRWLLVAYLSKVECVKAPSSIHVYAMGRKLFHALFQLHLMWGCFGACKCWKNKTNMSMNSHLKGCSIAHVAHVIVTNDTVAVTGDKRSFEEIDIKAMNFYYVFPGFVFAGCNFTDWILFQIWLWQVVRWRLFLSHS